MPDSMDKAQAVVADLVERFRRNLDAYQRLDYREVEVRNEYIDPFFEALGWDVHNHAGHAEPYKDVVHEESMRVAAGIEAPDYTFRIGGTRKFFVEAKKPSVNVKGDAGPAYQLRRYAWSGKLPLSILTDFEEFAVYDCTRRPAQAYLLGILPTGVRWRKWGLAGLTLADPWVAEPQRPRAAHRQDSPARHSALAYTASLR